MRLRSSLLKHHSLSFLQVPFAIQCRVGCGNGVGMGGTNVATGMCVAIGCGSGVGMGGTNVAAGTCVAIGCGSGVGVGVGTTPVVIRPILPPLKSVNHIAPSGPAVMPSL